MEFTMLDDWKHVLALIYIIPSWILYFIILYTIFFGPNRQNYSSSFYKIFWFSVINYIIHSASYYFVYRFTTIPMLRSFLETWPAESIWYPIIYIIMHYSAGAIHTYNLALSFNRATVFLYKNQHVLFWKRNLKFILAFCLLLPLIFVWTFPFIGIKNIPTGIYIVYLGPTTWDFVPWVNISRNLLIEISITSLLSLIMNLFVIYNLIKRRYSVPNGRRKASSQDSTMIVYSMLIFSTEAFSCMQQVSKFA